MQARGNSNQPTNQVTSVALRLRLRPPLPGGPGPETRPLGGFIPTNQPSYFTCISASTSTSPHPFRTRAQNGERRPGKGQQGKKTGKMRRGKRRRGRRRRGKRERGKRKRGKGEGGKEKLERRRGEKGRGKGGGGGGGEGGGQGKTWMCWVVGGGGCVTFYQFVWLPLVWVGKSKRLACADVLLCHFDFDFDLERENG